jgi:hypothetical protein
MGEWRYAPLFLTSVLGGNESSASRPGRFTPGEGAPGIHWTGGCAGPKAALNDVELRKISCPAGNRTPVVQPVAHRYTDEENNKRI